jgi:PAS domain-containing protein
LEYPCDSEGEKGWFELRAEPFGTTADKVVISHTDITQRKIAEEERELTYAKLKEAQRMAKVGSWEFNRVTRTCVFSDEMFDILEIDSDSRADLYAAYRLKFLPEDHDTFMALIQHMPKGKNDYSFNYYIKGKNNALKYIHEIGELIKNDKGEVIKLKGTIQDFTAIKLVNDKLTQKNEELIKANTELETSTFNSITSSPSSLFKII